MKALILGISILLTAGITAAEPQTGGILGQKAPDWEVDEWISLPKGVAKGPTLADLKGKTIYIYCFQAWCPGCHRSGFPTLQKVSEHFSGNDEVAFIAIQTVFEGFQTNTPENGRLIAGKYKLKHIPFAQSGAREQRSKVMRAYRTRGTPWTIIIGPDGTVKFNGFHLSPAQAIKLMEGGGSDRPRREGAAAGSGGSPGPSERGPAVLKSDALRNYVRTFNRTDHTHFGQAISNEDAADWMARNVPLFECPDKEIEEIYHFRWWTFRKHIKETPDGFVITEFLPKVSWSGKHNTISCPAGHHFREGRWIRNPKYLDDYAVFWFRKGGSPRRYSFPAADAIYNHALALGDFSRAINLLPELVANYEAWEKSRLEPDGLFWQIDDRDGGECSIAGMGHRGQGKRATINSYMFGDAKAIAAIAERAGKPEIAAAYGEKAARIKQLVLEKLWDEKAKFFKVLLRGENGELVDVRELHGFTPWYFNLPEPGKGYEAAWKQLMDPQGFHAPFGPTTAEQRHPGFSVSYEGHECQWNGPSWPFATAVTLTALANVLNDYPQQAVSPKDYFDTLKIYTKSHRLKRDDGTIVPWIDENLNPRTGDWIARTRLKAWRDGTWDPGKGGAERGKDYNHSTYCDLIVTGLVGLRPRADDTVVVNPLLPDGVWDFFRLDGVPYHGRMLTILYDKTGRKYGRGSGLRILANGKEIGAAKTLGRLAAQLPPEKDK